jgi:hypothetical protein
MNVSFFLVVFLSLASCLYCKRHTLVSSSIADAVASAFDDDNTSEEKVISLSARPSQQQKRHKLVSSSIADAVASAFDDDHANDEKVITLSGQPSQKMLAYSTSSYPQFKDLKAWSNYHKESGRIDSILGKCYECIRDRNNKGRHFFLFFFSFNLG